MSLEALIERKLWEITDPDLIAVAEQRIDARYASGELTEAEWERSRENAAKRWLCLTEETQPVRPGLRKAWDDHTAERTRWFPRDKDDLNAAFDAAVQRED